MYETISRLIPRDPDYPARCGELETLTRVLNGTLYDVLPYHFHDERSAAGEYIPLRQRRPSVRYPLSRIVVEDSVSLLFSEGHFPSIDCPDHATREAIALIVRDTHLNLIMTDAAIRGSIGSVAILMRVLNGRVFFEVMDTRYLTPIWNPAEPDKLLRIVERYKVTGTQLTTDGFDITEPGVTYWFQRIWDTTSETWYLPTPVGSEDLVQIDQSRTVRHELGFVPIVWIKNLPGPNTSGDPNDGACTFRAAIETQIEIDYQLSQAGRGLKYSSDPTLLLKEPLGGDADIIKGAGNALIVGEHGDARLLEIGGTAAAAVIEYVRTLREFALESVHGNRANPDRMTAPQSGKALQLMNQGLLWLADNLRITYGEAALLSVVKMIVQAARSYKLRTKDANLGPMDPAAPLSLKWPEWYPSTAADRQLDASTLVTLVNAGLISRVTALKTVTELYGVESITGELHEISHDQIAENEVHGA